jgi:hypothetical protein
MTWRLLSPLCGRAGSWLAPTRYETSSGMARSPIGTKAARQRWDAIRCRSLMPQLKVYGVGRLRVADGSIMPRVTTGNTMGPCVVIGERVGEMLKAER